MNILTNTTLTKYEEDTRYNVEAGYIKSRAQLYLWTLYFIAGNDLTRADVSAILSIMQAIHGEHAHEWSD